MLQSNLTLIFGNRGKAIDYSGKTIQGLTAFQAALFAGDVEMCAMMRDACSNLENGPAPLKEQYDGLFPQGIISLVRLQPSLNIRNQNAIKN